MTFSYGETFVVDIGHADVAYSLFDAWKAQGKDPRISTSTTAVAVKYLKTIVTIDREETDELGRQQT